MIVKFLRYVGASVTTSFSDLFSAPERRTFEDVLARLLPTQQERDYFTDAALMLAKVGITAEQVQNVAYAFARGELTVRNYTRNEESRSRGTMPVLPGSRSPGEGVR